MSAGASARAEPRLRRPPPAAPAGGGEGGEEPPRPWPALVLGCLALAALSLLAPSVPTYDPWAWIIWGREITEGDLNTVDGPSWKPLPVLFTAPFALAGDDAAPLLWILVARAGGLLAIAMAYRLGARLGGRPAGLIAGAALLLADEFVRNFARGNSEGLLVAVCLWAVERHLDGRRADAFLLGGAAALLRPEVWPFWGLYGLWLAWRHPRTRLLVAGSAVAVLALWFIPEWIGSGNFLRAAERARQPTPDSAAFADSPFLEVFRRSGGVLALPVLVGAALGLRYAWVDGRRPVPLALGAGAAVLMVAVALMTEAGFAGNLRYVALPAALLCVLAGAGWVEAVRRARARRSPRASAWILAAIALVSAPFVAWDVRNLVWHMHLLDREAELYGTLEGVVERAGGHDGLVRCGGIYTGDFQVQALAWYAHVHSEQVRIPPGIEPPGTIFGPGYGAWSRDPRFPLLFETERWTVRQRCR